MNGASGASSGSTGRVSSPEPRSSGGPANDAGPCGTIIGRGTGATKLRVPWWIGRGTSASVSGLGGGIGIGVTVSAASSGTAASASGAAAGASAAPFGETTTTGTAISSEVAAPGASAGDSSRPSSGKALGVPLDERLVIELDDAPRVELDPRSGVGVLAGDTTERRRGRLSPSEPLPLLW